MIVTALAYEDFRNLETGSIQPDEGVNIIYGSNAQGKTNLLEAIWFFTGGRSFRGAKDSDTVAFEKEKAALHMDFSAEGRMQQADITIDKRRTATLNGVLQSSPSRLAGHFCAVVFSPVHLSLIKDGPEGRRRFLDAAYCQLRPGYLRILTDYQRVLNQRNALLRTMRSGVGDSGALEVWNERLAITGAQVFAARTAYIRKLGPRAENIYEGISGGGENLFIHYHSAEGDETVPPSEAQKKLKLLLDGSLSADLAAGFTTVGPHRDDLVVEIGGISARAYASQGQQRSAVLALKLAEASVLREVTGEQPIALLDDVMSELDIERQDYILNHIHGWQVFLTCCDPSAVMRLTAGRAFHMEKGHIRNTENA